MLFSKAAYVQFFFWCLCKVVTGLVYLGKNVADLPLFSAVLTLICVDFVTVVGW